MTTNNGPISEDPNATHGSNDDHTDGGDHSSDHSRSHAHKRRPHTKSRNGCATCKRRRVKCDETRPVCKNCQHLRLECIYANPSILTCADLQITNLRLLHHYDTIVARTISDSGISTESIWSRDVVDMGLEFPFLMHAILMFSATHLAQRQPKDYSSAVVQHRSMALTLLRTEVQHIHADNLDPLVATSVLLILDAMANASPPSRMTPSSLPASTWLHHVRGAATILLAVGVLPPSSKFYSFLGYDLLDLASCYPPGAAQGQRPLHVLSDLQCTVPELQTLYPVAYDSPYYAALNFLGKLNDQRDRADFILRVFSFPALMDKNFVGLLASGDRYAKLVVSAYYRLVRSYVKDRQSRVWFLEGVSTVLPIDTDNEFGGLGFVTDALPVPQNVDSILARFDEVYAAAEQKLQQMTADSSKGNNSGSSNDHSRQASQDRSPQSQPLRSTIPQPTVPAPGLPQQALPIQGRSQPPQVASVPPQPMPIPPQAQPQPGMPVPQMKTEPDQYGREFDMDIFRSREFKASPSDGFSNNSGVSSPLNSLTASPDGIVNPGSVPIQRQLYSGRQTSQPPFRQAQPNTTGSAGNQVQNPVQNPGPVNGPNQQAASQSNLPSQPNGQNGNPNGNGNNPNGDSNGLGNDSNGNGNGTGNGSTGGNMHVQGYDPLMDPSYAYVSEIMPYTYGRIQKQMSNQNYGQWNQRYRSRMTPYMRARTKYIVRPGMMSVPMDPCIPEDLMGVAMDSHVDSAMSNDLGNNLDLNAGMSDMDVSMGNMSSGGGMSSSSMGGGNMSGGINSAGSMNNSVPSGGNDLNNDVRMSMNASTNSNGNNNTNTTMIGEYDSDIGLNPDWQNPMQQWNEGRDKSLEEMLGFNNSNEFASSSAPPSGPANRFDAVKEEPDENLDGLINFGDDIGIGDFS